MLVGTRHPFLRNLICRFRVEPPCVLQGVLPWKLRRLWPGGLIDLFNRIATSLQSKEFSHRFPLTCSSPFSCSKTMVSPKMSQSILCLHLVQRVQECELERSLYYSVQWHWNKPRAPYKMILQYSNNQGTLWSRRYYILLWRCWKTMCCYEFECFDL